MRDLEAGRVNHRGPAAAAAQGALERGGLLFVAGEGLGHGLRYRSPVP